MSQKTKESPAESNVAETGKKKPTVKKVLVGDQAPKVENPYELMVGSLDKHRKELKADGYGVINADAKITHMMIPLKDIEPLETQREVKLSWARKRIEEEGGLDKVAFGTPKIARFENDEWKANLCWDGLGRLAMAWLIHDPDTLIQCEVFHDMTVEDAARMFHLTQATGARKLSKETIFVNAFRAGEKEALRLASLLDFLDMYIQGETHHPVPHKKVGNPEISRAALEGGEKITDHSMGIQRLARDMICEAFKSHMQPNGKITQDLYYAICKLLVTYPALRKGAPYKSFMAWLTRMGADGMYTQENFNKLWKVNIKGASGSSDNDYVAPRALELLKLFYTTGAEKHIKDKLPLKHLDVS